MSVLTERTVFDDLRRRYSDKTYTQTTLVTHKGTIIAFAMDEDRRIFYAVLDLANQQDTEIDSAAWPKDPTQLSFPNEVEQVGYAIAGATSVPFVRKGSRLEAEPGFLRPEEIDNFLSTTARLSAQASFQVMSDNKHIYVFRQTVPSGHADNLNKLINGASSADSSRPGSDFVSSKGAKVAIVDSTLVCDRFILSGNSLLLSRECRFRRSRHKTQPANQSDALGTTDMEGKPFYMPTQELAFVKNLHDGCFHVLQLPTIISGCRRWQTFSHNNVSNRVDCFNFEVGADGLFNLAGTQLYTSPDTNYSDAVLERAPGNCPFTNQPLVPVQNETLHAETCLMLPASLGYAEATVSTPWDAPKFTIELFARAESLNQPSYTGLFACSSVAGENSFQLDLDGSGNYRLVHNTDTKLTLSPATLEWQHIAVSYDGSKLNGFVDGILVDDLDVTSLPVKFVKYIIGVNRGRNVSFNGCIDEVRIWNRARSAVEIGSDMRQRLIGNEPGLVSYFRLDEGSGTKAHDQCDTGTVATLQEDASWKVSDAPMGDNAGVRRSSFSIDGRLVKGGMCAKHFYQQEKVATGYDGSRKPMKKHSRVMLAMGTTNLSQSDIALATIDIAVSREGKLAQIPDVVLLPALTRSVRSTNLPRVRTLETEVRTLTDEIETLEGEIRSLQIQADNLPQLESEYKRLLRSQHVASDNLRKALERYPWMIQTYQYRLTQASEALASNQPLLSAARLASRGLGGKQTLLSQKEASVTSKTREITQLTGGQLAPMEVPMTCIHFDASGLSILGGLLKFANSEHTPQILDSALGQLGIYYRSSEPDGDLMVTYYETIVSRTRFFISPELTFTASLIGSAGPNTVTISGGDSSSTCTVTVTENSRNITETWTGLPRKPSKLADIMNGVSTRPTDVTAIVTPPIYDVSRRSCLVSAIVSKPNRDIAITDGSATVIEGLDSIWISDAPGRTYFFDYDVQQMKLPSSNLVQTVPENAVAVEAWINVDERNAGRARIVHHVSGDAAYTLSIVPTPATATLAAGQRKYHLVGGVSPGRNSSHSGQKFLRSSDAIDVNRWTHLGMRFEQSYALQFNGTQHVTCGKSVELDITTDLTIEIFLKIDDFSNGHGLLGKGCMGEKKKGVPYQLRLTSDRKVEFAMENDNGVCRTYKSTRALTAGNFHRIAVTRKGGTTNNSVSKPSTYTYVVDGQEKSMTVDTVSSVVVAEFSDINFHIDGVASGSHKHDDTPPLGHDGNFEIGRCFSSSRSMMYTRGIISEVRVWNRSLTPNDLNSNLNGSESGLVGWWAMEDHEGNVATDGKGSNDGRIDGARWVKSPDANANSMDLLLDGLQTATTDLTSTDQIVQQGWGDDGFYIGSATRNNAMVDKFRGSLEEIRVWKTTRTNEQIMDNLFTRLKGEKQDLMVYYTFDSMSCQDGAYNLLDNGLRGNNIPLSSTSTSRPTAMLSTAPISNESVEIRSALAGVKNAMHGTGDCAPSVAEYADMQRDTRGNLMGVLKRCYSYVKEGQWRLLTGYKVGNLITEWIGQAQFDPQIMGYIEGAPPIPSENFVNGLVDTVVDAATVEVTESESVTHSIAASKEGSYDVGFSASANLVAGSDDLLLTAPLGFGLAKKVTTIDIDVGAQGNFNVSEGWSQEETTSRSMNRAQAITMGTAGDFESPDAAHQRNAATGCRALPVNMGMALVQSSTADIFALRLEHNNALVSYRMLPNPDIPKDWNMIPFPINKKYTKQGTLDGRIGYSAVGALVLDEDYDNCSGYGEYSYFKPKEAYAMERNIRLAEQRSQSFYEDYGTGFGSTVGKVVGSAAGAAAGMLVPLAGPAIAAASLAYGISSVTNAVDSAKIDSTFSKRDIVNTYVWSADGGFFAESTETSDVRTEVTAGTFQFSGAAGGTFQTDIEVFSFGLTLAFEAAIGGGMSVTKTKSKEAEKTFGINVSLNVPGSSQKYELNDIGEFEAAYDSAGKPVLVSGRVDAYRFKTFYLDASSENFEDLFGKVIDPIWLRTDNPNAIALRQAQQSEKKPPCWRVFHRVTFVSRVLPDFPSSAADTVETTMKAQNINSNWQLIQKLEPFLKNKLNDPALFNSAVHDALDEYLPELKPHASEVVAYMRLYYGIPE